MEKVMQVSSDELKKEVVAQPTGKSLVRNFESKKPMNKEKILLVLLAFGVISAGAMTGYFLSSTKASGSSGGTKIAQKKEENKQIEVQGDIEEAFPDTAEGMMVAGGIDGEGTHHLDRGLGEEKYVYLTSSVVDLDGFVGKKVQVWGQTLSGKEAGWLMDVGRVKEIE